MQVFLVLALIFAMAIAVFAIQNPTAILFSFFLWEWRIPLVLVILGSAAIGAIFAMLLGLSKQISKRTEVNRAKQELKRLERELAQKEEALNHVKKQLDELKSGEQLEEQPEKQEKEEEETPQFSAPMEKEV